ncbi:cysteine rich repeat-containing protein [Mesorhizobium yinganensis]|uniref:cysteine rich repeat-containing protein n=1 Tax=Mesorhizobium yinganensis TaxID=3157707 RepID=UPI0032BE1FDD
MARRRNILAGAVLMAAFGAIGIAQAQTISFADAATVLAKDCGADIKKLCSGVNLGNNQIQSCLERHQAKVSPTCTSTLASVTASIEQRLAAQAVVFKVCGGDAATLCKGVKGEAHILQCLIKTTRIDGGKCNQAITDAGWR